MNCKVTLIDDCVTFQAQDIYDLARQIKAENTFTVQDIKSIVFEKKELRDYEDSIFEDLSSLRVLLNTPDKTNLDETFHSLVANLGYDDFFTGTV